MSDTTAIILKRNAQHPEHAGHGIGYTSTSKGSQTATVACACGERLEVDLSSPNFVLVANIQPTIQNMEPISPGNVPAAHRVRVCGLEPQPEADIMDMATGKKVPRADWWVDRGRTFLAGEPFETATDITDYFGPEHRYRWEPDPGATDRARVLKLATEAFYQIDGNQCGGALHLVLDDGNIEDEHIAFCLTQAVERGDKLGAAIAREMMKLTWDERCFVVGKDPTEEP